MNTQEEVIQEWVEKSLGINLPFDLLESLRDGTLLCKILRRLRPDLGITLREQEKTREAALSNISEFLRGCLEIGVPEEALFSPLVLFDQLALEPILQTLGTLITCLRNPPSSSDSPLEEELTLEDLPFEEDQLHYITSSLDFLQQSTSQLTLMVIQDNSLLEESLRKMQQKGREVDGMALEAGSFLGGWSEELARMERCRNDVLLRLDRVPELLHQAPTLRSEVNYVEQIKRPTLPKSPQRLSFMRPKSSINEDHHHHRSSSGLTGTMQITLISASDLLPCDSTGFSDPYCILKVGRENKMEKVGKTNTLIQTLNPVWDESFKVSLKNANLLSIKCMDWDRFSQDDVCGETSLNLTQFFTQDQKETKSFNLKFDTQGSIDLHIKWEPFSINS